MKEEEIVCNRWLVVSGLFLVSSDYVSFDFQYFIIKISQIIVVLVS